MLLFSQSSHKLWLENFKAFEELDLQTDWKADVEEIEGYMLQILKVNQNLDLGYRFVFAGNKIGQWIFINKTKRLRFPPFRELCINYLNQLPGIFLKSLQEFFIHSRPKKLSELFLGSSDTIN